MAPRSSTRSVRRLWATISPAPTTTSARPAMPPEMRYGICAVTRVVGRGAVPAEEDQDEAGDAVDDAEDPAELAPAVLHGASCSTVVVMQSVTRRGSVSRRLALADLVADAGEDQRALLHDQDAVGVRQHADVLLDDDHRDAVVVDPLDDLEHGLGQRRAEPERRLVDEQQPRLGHQRPPDRQHLLLAARQRAGRPGRRARRGAGSSRTRARAARRARRAAAAGPRRRGAGCWRR